MDAPLPDRGHLLTETRLADSANLDALSTADVLAVMNEQDALIHTVLRAAIPAIAGLIDAVAAGMNRGGRLIYVGAGTSGRLGVLDASECPPTFCTSPRQVVGIIAGGDPALRRSSEGKEDDPQGAVPELETLEIDDRDTVIGIAAGGTTPYVHGALQHAKAQGSTVGLITCVRADAVQG
ncbi:MAG: N-acetylmuramic acid 6-phosphate etherase, partial [Phycisphaeraceae bacterium]|nr:N-acetylmuramic acid 6-phosphate etherase [Phycisphaeraceae bacterium]